MKVCPAIVWGHLYGLGPFLEAIPVLRCYVAADGLQHEQERGIVECIRGECGPVAAGFDRLIKEGVVPHCTTARFKIAPTQPDPRARGSGGCFGACAGKRQIAVPRMGTQHRGATQRNQKERARSDEHTSELQSLMR